MPCRAAGLTGRLVAPHGPRKRALACRRHFRQREPLGLASFYVNPGSRVDYRLLGAYLNRRLSPLALPGREDEVVVRTVAEALARAHSRQDFFAFKAIDAEAPWLEMIKGAWPERFKPWRHVSSHHPGPVVVLAGSDYESWLLTRSKRFREEMRKARQDAERAGGKLRPARDEIGAERSIEALARFHAARWAQSGTAFGSEIFAAITEAASGLLPRGELRIWILDIEGDPIAVWIFPTAGRRDDRLQDRLRRALVGSQTGTYDASRERRRRVRERRSPNRPGPRQTALQTPLRVR